MALAAVGLVCVAWAASRQSHPATRVLAGAFCGLGALGAVNLLGSYTGVTLALNYAAAYASVVLGAPGVITLLVLRAVLGLAYRKRTCSWAGPFCVQKILWGNFNAPLAKRLGW